MFNSFRFVCAAGKLYLMSGATYVSKSQGVKYLPITFIMHDTQCIITQRLDWTIADGLMQLIPISDYYK